MPLRSVFVFGDDAESVVRSTATVLGMTWVQSPTGVHLHDNGQEVGVVHREESFAQVRLVAEKADAIHEALVPVCALLPAIHVVRLPTNRTWFDIDAGDVLMTQADRALLFATAEDQGAMSAVWTVDARGFRLQKVTPPRQFSIQFSFCDFLAATEAILAELFEGVPHVTFQIRRGCPIRENFALLTGYVRGVGGLFEKQVAVQKKLASSPASSTRTSDERRPRRRGYSQAAALQVRLPMSPSTSSLSDIDNDCPATAKCDFKRLMTVPVAQGGLPRSPSSWFAQMLGERAKSDTSRTDPVAARLYHLENRIEELSTKLDAVHSTLHRLLDHIERGQPRSDSL